MKDKAMPMQPVEYIHANKLPFIEGNVVECVSLWRSKGGIKDLEKAKQFIEILIELERRDPMPAADADDDVLRWVAQKQPRINTV